eukprot:6996779-Prymnesium_polylepis.1
MRTRCRWRRPISPSDDGSDEGCVAGHAHAAGRVVRKAACRQPPSDARCRCAEVGGRGACCGRRPKSHAAELNECDVKAQGSARHRIRSGVPVWRVALAAGGSVRCACGESANTRRQGGIRYTVRPTRRSRV